MKKKTLVIIGGGFGGLNLIKHLRRGLYDIKLVDRNNFHSFPPLYYQVASSGLAPSDISFPLRRELARRGDFTYHMGRVLSVDTEAKVIRTDYESIPYDLLVIAAGTTNNFFGMEDMDRHVFCIKSVQEAVRTRDEILDRLERGAICTDPELRRQLLSFVVIGGGPAGVEIAGALGEMKKYVLPREYPELDPSEVKIKLVEGGPRLLAAMGEKAGSKAALYLRQLMVDVCLNTAMKAYSDKRIEYADGTSEYCGTLVWTAGVKGVPMPGIPAGALTHGDRIVVDEYNRVRGVEDVFAIGDIACMVTEEYPHGHPQVAQPAIQQGRNLASNLNRGEMTAPFRYRDKGSMATVGKHRAVVLVGNRCMSGYVAWLIWMFIHLISLLGMKNRISVMTNWVWNYMTYSSQLRLLFRPTKYPHYRHWSE